MMKCLRCEVEMLFYSRVSFSKFPTAYSGFAYEMLPKTPQPKVPIDIYVCPECKKLEMFLSADSSSYETVICPHCHAEATIRDPSDTVCSHCGKDLYEKIRGRDYIRPRNF